MDCLNCRGLPAALVIASLIRCLGLTRLACDFGIAPRGWQITTTCSERHEYSELCHR